MMTPRVYPYHFSLLLLFLFFSCSTGFAQADNTMPSMLSGEHHLSHEHMHHSADPDNDDSIGEKSTSDSAMTAMPMSALYGRYSPTREASGTAWQPDSTPMEAYHFMSGEWSFMTHGFINGIYNRQGGMRGEEKGYSSSMLMLMGSRDLGEGTFGFRSMLSADALMGKSGYPELLQTGETSDGNTELIDRQHPHDLFMEMALTYSLPVSKSSSVFIYGGLPGEPAIGPAAFMHRASGDEIPDAPITHHWLDSTHITEGVVTLGYVVDAIKFEGSVFNGREPDQDRYDIETRKLDSWSGRFSYNPSENWTTQVSFANLDSPEQVHPEIGTKRTTLSATYNLPLPGKNWASTLAWGRNQNSPGELLDGFLLESELTFEQTHTIFTRFENVEKDELFADVDPQARTKYRVSRLGAGYIYDFIHHTNVKVGIGSEAVIGILPGSLEDTYGESPLSVLIFIRAKII